MTTAEKCALRMQNGRHMPAVGLGTLAPQQTEEEVITALKAAVKAGYRHIDCAAIYRNERAIGHALKSLIVDDTITRENVFITSKLWNTCHRPDLVRPSLMKTLEDLRTPYVDLYLIHWPMAYKEGGELLPWDGDTGKVIFSDVDYLETWKAMEDCVDEGLAKNIGMSNFNSKQIQRILSNARIKPSVNQVEINCHNGNRKLIEFCQSVNIPVAAFAPLGTPGDPKPERKTALLEEDAVKEIAKRVQKSPAQVCERFLLQQGLAVIPKSANPTRIEENIQIFDFELCEDDMQKLFALNKNFRVYDEQIAIGHKYYPFTEEF